MVPEAVPLLSGLDGLSLDVVAKSPDPAIVLGTKERQVAPDYMPCAC
jgi:hypothetical protein